MNPVIVVVAYRRLHTLQRLLKSISEAEYQCENVTLIISIDYHPDNSDVIKCAEDYSWVHGKKIVCTHDENLGLRKHIIECGSYSIQYDAVILLEDDELVAPMFYEYTRRAHEYYAQDSRIAGVSLYGREWNDYECRRFQPLCSNGDVYFGQFSCTRGQSWTKGQWEAFLQWYEKNTIICQDEKLPPPIYAWKESWGKFFIRYLVETEKYYVIPRKPVCTVYGETGTHSCRAELNVQNAMYWGNEEFRFVPFEKASHYDAFYENSDLKKIISRRFEIDEAEICIDLYGLRKRMYGGQRYLLTTRKMNYKVLTGYDLNLRPHEVNVILNMSGTGIFLYDSTQNAKNRIYDYKNHLEYTFAGLRGPEALLYGITHIFEVIRDVLCRVLSGSK